MLNTTSGRIFETQGDQTGKCFDPNPLSYDITELENALAATFVDDTTINEP